MNDGGYYDGWTEHDVIISADFLFGMDIKVKGKNKRDIKEYIVETFDHVLYEEYVWNGKTFTMAVG
jgi:hypothetical protein